MRIAEIDGEYSVGPGGYVPGSPIIYNSPYFFAKIGSPATKDFTLRPFYAWQELEVVQDPNNPMNFILQVKTNGRSGTLNADGSVSNPAMEMGRNQHVPVSAVVEMIQLGLNVLDPEQNSGSGMTSATYLFQFELKQANITEATLGASLLATDTTAHVTLPDSSTAYADNKFKDQGAYNDVIILMGNPPESDSNNPWTLLRVQPKTVTLPVDVGYDSSSGSWWKQTQDFYVQGPAGTAGSNTPYVACQSVTNNLQRDTTTIVLDAPTTPITVGTTATLTATVSHTAGVADPSGYVVFFVDGTQVGSGASVGTGGVATSGYTVPVGSHTVTAQYMGDQFYNSSVSSGQSLVVNRATPTVTIAVTPSSVTYGDSTAVTATLTAPSGAITTGLYRLYDGSTMLLQNTTGTFVANLKAGTRSITVQFDGNTDLASATSAATSVTVAKAALTLTALPAVKQYGDSNPALLWVLSGFVLGDTQSSSGLTGSPNISTTVDETTDIGSYTVSAAVGSLAFTNYTASVFVNSTISVQVAYLTLQADDQSRPQGQPNPPLTVTIAGLRNSDNLGVNASTSATAYSPKGVYSIIPSASDPDGKLHNYTVNYINGALTVS